FAGRSLGEYSALVSAGAMKLRGAAALVRKRGRYMQEAVPVGGGAMAGLAGLEVSVVQAICGRVAVVQLLSPATLICPGPIWSAGLMKACSFLWKSGRAKSCLVWFDLSISQLQC